MERKYLTVTALNRYLKAKIDADSQLQKIYIMGEISNFKHHSSGHLYFTLKDENSRVNAVMFSSKARKLPFEPANGMKVFIQASVSIYDVAGTYQLYVDKMEQDGLGNLFLRYEQLKKQLAGEGLFSPENKKQIPKFPSRIAVLSGYPSAALADVVRTIKLRFPVVRIVAFPIPVQGKDAYIKICRMLKYVDSLNFNTIIIIAHKEKNVNYFKKSHTIPEVGIYVSFGGYTYSSFGFVTSFILVILTIGISP